MLLAMQRDAELNGDSADMSAEADFNRSRNI
jgi:hypothetical protein